MQREEKVNAVKKTKKGERSEQKGKLIDKESESIRGNWIYRERGERGEEKKVGRKVKNVRRKRKFKKKSMLLLWESFFFFLIKMK